MRILLIDNYDSFTFNLFQLFATLGARVDVVKNDAITVDAAFAKRPTHIVISPGPGTPDDSGISNAVIKKFAGKIPLLGVCLGHQCIARVFTTNRNPVGHAPVPVHGKISMIHHDKKGLMRGVPSPFEAARYHSLIVDALPPDFELMCWTGKGSSALIMGMHHKTLPVFGVQFHPESFLTEHGKTIAKNFLHCR